MTPMRRSFLVGLIALGSLSLGGCDDEVCDDSAAAGLVVTVVHRADGPICDARVVVDLGTHEEVLDPFPTAGADPCRYTGLYEQPGTFRVTATRDGFSPATAMVTVENAACHVRTEQLTLTLDPLPQP